MKSKPLNKRCQYFQMLWNISKESTYPSLWSVRYSLLVLSIEVLHTKFFHTARYGNALFVSLARLQIRRPELTEYVWNLLLLIKKSVHSHVYVLLTIHLNGCILLIFLYANSWGLVIVFNARESLLAANFDVEWRKKPKIQNTFLKNKWCYEAENL